MPAVGGEADEHHARRGWRSRISWPMLSSPRCAHLGGPRVADVGVVLPHDHAARAVVPVDVRHQVVEGVGHVAVAQVPGGRRVAEHRAVVLLGVGHQRGVLLGEEVLVLGDQRRRGAGSRPRRRRSSTSCCEHVPPARVADPEQDGAAVLGALAAVGLQALVATARPLGRCRVVHVEVGDHGLDRGAQAVEVEPVEADRGRRIGEADRCARAASRRSRARRRCATSRSGSAGSPAAPARRPRRRPAPRTKRLTR